MTHHTRSVFGIIATMVLGIFLSVTGCKKDDATPVDPGPDPITADLFPLQPGRQFEYSGFLVMRNSVETPVPGTAAVYHTTWTLLPHPAGDGTWLIKDSTAVGQPGNPVFLQISKAANGDFSFRQTLGPFYRAFNVQYTDTLIWVQLARPSQGVGRQWTAFDTTVTGEQQGQSVPVRLQIFGKIDGQVQITDSTSANQTHTAYLVRTWRKVTVGTIVAQDDAITARLWLVPNIGPVQVNIAGDSENFGHFRVMKHKNF